MSKDTYWFGHYRASPFTDADTIPDGSLVCAECGYSLDTEADHVSTRQGDDWAAFHLSCAAEILYRAIYGEIERHGRMPKVDDLVRVKSDAKTGQAALLSGKTAKVVDVLEPDKVPTLYRAEADGVSDWFMVEELQVLDTD